MGICFCFAASSKDFAFENLFKNLTFLRKYVYFEYLVNHL